MDKVKAFITNVRFVYSVLAGFVVAVAAVVWFFVENKSLKTGVDTLKQSNKELRQNYQTLNETVSGIKQAQDVVNNTLRSFVDNPPGELKYRIQQLEEDVDRYHPQHDANTSIDPDTVEFVPLGQ